METQLKLCPDEQIVWAIAKFPNDTILLLQLLGLKSFDVELFRQEFVKLPAAVADTAKQIMIYSFDLMISEAIAVDFYEFADNLKQFKDRLLDICNQNKTF